jgi:hypothetical protein
VPAGLDQVVQRLGVPAVRPGGDQQDTRGQLTEAVGELVVGDQHRRALLAQHLADGVRGQRGVQQGHVGAQLGGGDRELHRAAVVAAEHRDRGVLAHAAVGQRGGQPVGAFVHLGEREQAPVVDHRRPVRVPGGAGGVAGGHAQTPAQVPAGHADRTVRSHRGHDAGLGHQAQPPGQLDGLLDRIADGRTDVVRARNFHGVEHARCEA